MTTKTRERLTRQLSPLDYDPLLDGIDERLTAIELSAPYLASLSPGEYLALHRAARRNGIPLRLV